MKYLYVFVCIVLLFVVYDAADAAKVMCASDEDCLRPCGDQGRVQCRKMGAAQKNGCHVGNRICETNNCEIDGKNEDELAGLTPRRRLLTSLRRARQRSVTDETPQQRAIARSSSFRSSSQRSANSTQTNDDSNGSMMGTTTPKRKTSLKIPIQNHETRNLLTTYCILLLLLISLYLLYSGLF